MEGYFELVVERLNAAGYRWYETANFCLAADADATSARSTTSRTGSGGTISASGSAPCRRSAASVDGTRRGSTPYVSSLARGERAAPEVETLDELTRDQERLMLGLRLDTGLPLAEAGALGRPGCARPRRAARSRDPPCRRRTVSDPGPDSARHGGSAAP